MSESASKGSRSARWRGYAINVLLIVVVVSGMRFWKQRDMVSGAAPALHGITLAGEGFSLREHLQRPLLVHFWATWCPVCKAEQDNIAALVRSHGNVITIAMQSGRDDEVAAYMKQQGLVLPVLNDSDGSISSAWGVHAVPASFIIGSDGTIRFVEVGYTTELGLWLRLWWSGL